MTEKLFDIRPTDTPPQEQDLIPPEAWQLAEKDHQKAIPSLAKSRPMMKALEEAARQLPTSHRLIHGDSRDLSLIPDQSLHLALTSPSYWTLKEYPENPAQLGHIADYEAFLQELDNVWRHIYRVLVPGGRLIIVVGDVCLPPRQAGRHIVYPLHASLQEHCRHIGFDNLAPIIWHKIANAKFEVDNGGGFLGKPYEPNAVVKNGIEFILFQRKGGGYRQPTLTTRLLSVIPESLHREWFQPVWTLNGASTRNHPAPYPLALAERLVRMFYFVGDTVLDPFMGTGTTSEAAARWGRNSVGVEVEPGYFEMSCRRMEELRKSQFRMAFAPLDALA
jgi:DNA modification methylase